MHGFPPGIFRCRGNLPLHNSVGLEPLTHERICQIPGRPRRNLSNPDLVKNLVKSLGAPRNLTNLILSKILSNLPRKVMGPRRHCSITACAGGYQSLSNFIQLRLRPFSTALMTLPRQAAARSDLTARGRPAATHVHQSLPAASCPSSGAENVDECTFMKAFMKGRIHEWAAGGAGSRERTRMKMNE